MVKKVFIASTFSLNMLEDMTGVFKSHICLIDEIRGYVELLNNGDGKTVKLDDVEVINGFGHQNTADDVMRAHDEIEHGEYGLAWSIYKNFSQLCNRNNWKSNNSYKDVIKQEYRDKVFLKGLFEGE